MIREAVTTSVHRRVTILMIALAVVAFGAVGFSRLPVNLLPNLSYPTLTIQTEFPNAAPAEVEQLITRPVEEVVGVLKGLQQIHSVSRSGISEVTLEFGWNASMTELAMDVREKLDRLVLPDEALSPVVLRYDPSLDPIMKLSLSGRSDLSHLRLVGDKKVKEMLERIEGVASANIQGGLEEEIQILIDQGKAALMGLSMEQLAAILSESNINRPGGSLRNAQTQLLVRTVNEFDNLEEVRQLRITPANKPAVLLGEIATVSWGNKDRDEIARFGGTEGIMVSVYKEGDANTVEVAERVKAELAKLNRELPKGDRLAIVFDQSRFIQQSIDEVKSSLMIGGLLAIAVLWVFLRQWKLTAIIATAIPLSVIATFILMYRSDVSLNIMSLGGLTLGVGMLVDSAIVVLESIYRRREEGLGNREAAIEGTVDVGGAVTASVLTTIAVFMPIVFVEGIAGQLFKDQALTVTYSLVASLIVSFTLAPMLASLGKDKRTEINTKADSQQKQHESRPTSAVASGKANARFKGTSWYHRLYRPVLEKVLRHPKTTIASGFILLALCYPLARSLQMDLIPQMSEGEFYFDVELPEGTALPTTSRLMAQMEAIALEQPGVASVYSSVGSRNVSGGLALKAKDENLGQINIVITDRANSELEAQVINQLRSKFDQIPDAKIQFGRPSFFSLKTPLALHFFGEDLTQLRDYSRGLLEQLTKVPGIKDVRASLEAGNPELSVTFDRKKLARLGLTIEAVSDVINQRVNGSVVTRFQQPDRQIDVRIRNRAEDRADLSDIRNIVIGQVNGVNLTLSAVATVEQRLGPSAIDRIQQSRVAIITANTDGIGLSELRNRVSAILKENPPPIGIDFEFGGQDKEMEKSFNSLLFAIALAVFLVYIVMAATFEHTGHPFVILLTIPLALIGVIIGLYVTGYTLSVIAMIGVVFLVGIVVNNAIVLVDAINQLRRRSVEKLEAIKQAAQSRLRPILMTTCTTVLGLLPMAIGFGEGAELRAPLAVVVSWGLVFSTALTLLVIPATYLVVPSKVRTLEEEAAEEERLHQAEEIESHHDYQSSDNQASDNQASDNQASDNQASDSESSPPGSDKPPKSHIGPEQTEG